MMLMLYNFLIFFLKAFVVGTCLNSNEYPQYVFTNTGCNLKTTKLIDCVFIGACAVIKSNTVCPNSMEESTSKIKRGKS